MEKLKLRMQVGVMVEVKKEGLTCRLLFNLSDGP